MSLERRQRIGALFESALELPADSVEGFLRRECGGDTGLEDEVRRMLRARAAGSFLDHTPMECTTPSTETMPADEVRFRGLVHARLKGRYLIQRELGHGGFGVVYLAQDENLLSKKVVVKVLLGTGLDPWRRRKFRNEMEALARLSHPSIVSISDSGETEDGRPFLVMEYVEGQSLRCLLRPEGLQIETIAVIVRQAGGALEAAHRSGIWHRDLKPENVMIQTLKDGELRVKLIDFGIATVIDSGEPAETVSRIAGTLRYMAPEQLSGRPSASSDLYSLAVITYEMLTGRLPLRAENAVQLHAMQKAGVQIAPRSLRPDLPEEAEQAILKALAFEESDRQHTVAEFVRELSQGLRAASSPSAAIRSATGQPRWKEWRPRVVLTVLLAAASVVTAAAFTLRSPYLQTSMVVFQINDLVNDPAYRPLSRGLTGALLSRLIRVKGLSVKQYYGTRDPATTAAIKDRFYLDGDLQKYQSQIRLTMRLTDTEKGNSVVWSNSFDRDLDNPLELENEVAQQVVDGLEDDVFSPVSSPQRVQFAGRRVIRWFANLLGDSEVQVTSTQDPIAYRAYARGRQLYEERSPAAIQSAIQSLQQAVNQDPNFALAFAALSDAYRAALDEKLGTPDDMIGRSLWYAQKAVSLNPKLPEAHAALAGVRQAQWDWEGSERSYREAIRLDPKSPVAYRRYGGLILQFGRFDEALQYMTKGLDLDPYDYASHSAYGMALLMARRYGEAEERLKWTLAQRNLISAHDVLGWVYATRGRQSTGDEAKRYFDLALGEARAVHDLEIKGAAAPQTAPTLLSDDMFAVFYAMRGDRLASRRFLDRLISRPDADTISPADLAEIYAALGETATAISYLERAARIKDRGMLYLKVNPVWDAIRNTDGFRKILLTMRF
jgi:serine/threonine-protein kinase